MKYSILTVHWRTQLRLKSFQWHFSSRSQEKEIGEGKDVFNLGTFYLKWWQNTQETQNMSKGEKRKTGSWRLQKKKTWKILKILWKFILELAQAAWGFEGEDTLDTGKALTGPPRLHDKRAKIHMLKAPFFLASTEASAWQRHQEQNFAEILPWNFMFLALLGSHNWWLEAIMLYKYCFLYQKETMD